MFAHHCIVVHKLFPVAGQTARQNALEQLFFQFNGSTQTVLAELGSQQWRQRSRSSLEAFSSSRTLPGQW